jgi:hypothetical protein
MEKSPDNDLNKFWRPSWPKTVIPRYRVLLFGLNRYIYDYKRFDLVKDVGGNVITISEIPNYYGQTEEQKNFYKIFEELVRVDMANQMDTIKNRQELIEANRKKDGFC